jgi:hypothetical protein
MPTLSFLQLAKIFAVGFLGYAVLLCLLALGTVALFPLYVSGRLDMSPGTLYMMVFYYLGVPGLAAASVMLVTAWSVLRLSRRV